jgi:hypothetical protein
VSDFVDRAKSHAQQATRESQAEEMSGEDVGLSSYPELAPVLSLAVDAVVFTFDIDEETDADVVAHLARTTAEAVVPLYAPIAAFAAQIRTQADDSHASRAAAVARAAEAMAASVAAVAEALRTRGEASAVRAAGAATEAAEQVAASAAAADDPAKAAATAAQVARAVHNAAATAAAERARAASLVAQAATTAAAEVAAAADQVDIAAELEVFSAAMAVRAIALDSCYQLGINVAATTAETALNGKNAE